MVDYTCVPQNEQELEECLKNKLWRLHNLYYIINENGDKVKFKPRPAQLDFIQNRHGVDVILKARQLGFSTVIQIDMLDDCLFKANTSAAVIAQSLDDCKKIFQTKFKTPYKNLDPEIRRLIPAVADSMTHMEFGNGSTIQVTTSGRSSTNNVLHISEYGKICTKYPERAKEIRTGALNTVHLGNKIVIESTAEGQTGHFYETCKVAEDKQKLGKILTPQEFKFHFYPWWRDPKYTIDPAGVLINDQMQQYFDKLRGIGIQLTPGQKAWYIKKEETQGEEMKREFPSYPDEAFEQSIEGAYFAHEMSKARIDSRIGDIPFDPSVPVNTFWDIGVGDHCAIWFHQRVGLQNRFIKYYENSGEAFPHYAKYLANLDCIYGAHYLPHDAGHRSFRKEGTLLTDAYELLKGEIYHVPRVGHKQDAIEAARKAINSCWFDEETCATGIKHLDNYRKEWNDHLGTWRNTPRHDEASHGADAFMTFATGYDVHQQQDSVYVEMSEDEHDYSSWQQVQQMDYTGY